MGKKHKHPEHENLERWLVSYADFITLLFATFVVLYALSQADLAKFKSAGESIKQAFNPGSNIMKDPGGIMKGTPDAKILKNSGNSVLEKVSPKYLPKGQAEGQSKPTRQMAQAVAEINKEIEKQNKAAQKGKGKGEGAGKPGAKGQAAAEDIGLTTLKIQERGVVISFASSLFFEPGTAGLKPAAFPVLDKVSSLLAQADTVIHIEGHTDSQPMVSAIYPSNWELSCARASSVLRYFIAHHQLPPAKLAAVGYGDTRPVADNASVEGRQQNRRVDIVILKADVVEEADAGAAQETEHVVFSGESEGGVGLATEPESKPVPKPESKIELKSDPKPLLKPELRPKLKPKAVFHEESH